MAVAKIRIVTRKCPVGDHCLRTTKPYSGAVFDPRVFTSLEASAETEAKHADLLKDNDPLILVCSIRGAAPKLLKKIIKKWVRRPANIAAQAP
jgi:hypothetical protein